MHFEGFHPEQPTQPKLESTADQKNTENSKIDSRQNRLDHLHKKIEGLFEGEKFRALRTQIERSLETPQWGTHHNEGMFMDSHIDLIMEQIDAVEQNIFHPKITEATQVAMHRAIVANKEHMERYALLHDISKPDCMTLKFVTPKAAQQLGFDSAEPPITLEAWKELLEKSELGRMALNGDEHALKLWCEQHELKGISYYQIGKMHGETGATTLHEMNLGIDATTLVAIEHHEDAFQFSYLDVQRYMSCYRGVTEAGRDYATLGSYVDSMASLLKDGTPDLTNFEYLANSREKLNTLIEVLLELGGDLVTREQILTAFDQFLDNKDQNVPNLRKPILDLVERIGQERFDARKLAIGFEKLFFSDVIVRNTEKETILKKMESEFGLAQYDESILQAELPNLITEGGLSEDEIEPLIRLLKKDQTNVLQKFGKKIGRRMQDFKAILAKAKI